MNTTHNFATRPRIRYVVEASSSSSEDRQKNSKNKDQLRGSGERKFKDTVTPPLKKKFEFDESDDQQKKAPDKSNSISKSTETTRKDFKDVIKYVKFVVYGATVVILIVSFGLLSLGVFLKADLSFSQFLSENYRQTTETKFTAPSLYKGTYALIILSCLTIVTCFAGCCGVIRGSVCLLGFYFSILVVLLIIKLSAGFLWYFRRDSIEREVAIALDYMVQHYYQGPGIVQEVLDSLQTVFRCCGNAGCGDFVSLRLTVPRTCDLDCLGCRDRMFRVLRDGFIAINIFGSIMLLAELVLIICILFLICRLKNQGTVTTVVYELSEDPKRKNLFVDHSYDINKPTEDKMSSKKVVYLAYPANEKLTDKNLRLVKDQPFVK